MEAMAENCGKQVCTDATGLLTVTTQVVDYGEYMGGVQTVINSNILKLPFGKTFGDISEMFMLVSGLSNITRGTAKKVLLRWDASLQRFFSAGELVDGASNWSSVIISGMGSMPPSISENPIDLSANSVQNIGIYNQYNSTTYQLPIYEILKIAIAFK